MTRRFALVLALYLAACGSDSAQQGSTGGTTGGTSGTSTGTTTVGGTTGVSYTGPTVAYGGRFVAHGTTTNSYDFAWSGASILTRFTGTSVAIGLSTASNANIYFDVRIDDGTPTTLLLSPGVSRYTVMSPDPKAAHTVRWTRITEATYGMVTVTAPTASADGTLQPTPTPSARNIEFIGDSITAGYGVLGVNPNCTGAPDNQDADLAYPALVGKAFAANYAQLGFSGKGIYRNADCTTTDLVPALYDYAIPPEVQNANSVAWDTSQFSPAVIVLNVGTNDFTAANYAAGNCNTVISNGGLPIASTYQAAYVAFLQKLTAAHPDAYIIVVYGPMLTSAQMSADAGFLNAALSTVNDAKISLLPVGPQGTATGCNYHPNPATHAQIAQSLEAAIVALPLGWTTSP